MKARPLHISALLLVKIAWTAIALYAQPEGPDNGSLVIVGGNMNDATIVQQFIDLAGGPDALIVVIPTAGGADEYDVFYPGLKLFRSNGARNLVVLHTKDRAEADSVSFVAPIREAGGVWFSGGRQWRLADSYMGTRTETEFWNLLKRGGVIGGSSAGATIQGEYLARGDTETNTIMMGDHEQGFGFLSGVAIDQHLLRRNRHFDLLEIVRARPELLGIGLDENTAIVVSGDHFEVVGQSYVAIYDAGKMVDEVGPFYFLSPGDRFELSTRTPLRRNVTFEPLERIEERPWPGQ